MDRKYRKLETSPQVVFASRPRHTRLQGDWSSDVCSSDLGLLLLAQEEVQLVDSVDRPVPGDLGSAHARERGVEVRDVDDLVGDRPRGHAAGPADDERDRKSVV